MRIIANSDRSHRSRTDAESYGQSGNPALLGVPQRAFVADGAQVQIIR